MKMMKTVTMTPMTKNSTETLTSSMYCPALANHRAITKTLRLKY